MTIALLALAAARAQDVSTDPAAGTVSWTTTTAAGVADPTTGTSGEPVYQDYASYLDALDTIGELPVAPPGRVQGQLDTGVATLIDYRSNDVALGFIAGKYPDLVETWFYDDPLKANRNFTLHHLGINPGDGAIDVNMLDPGWEQRPCTRLLAHYSGVPNQALTVALDNVQGITRTAFDVKQDGKVRGRLLREWHTVQGWPTARVDHWVFFQDYVMPANDGEEVQMVATGQVYTKTSQFFSNLNNGYNLTDARYAQIQVHEVTGWDCVAALQP